MCIALHAKVAFVTVRTSGSGSKQQRAGDYSTCKGTDSSTCWPATSILVSASLNVPHAVAVAPPAGMTMDDRPRGLHMHNFWS